MTWYLFAYVAFWAALFGYLLGLSSRQARLNRANQLFLGVLDAQDVLVGLDKYFVARGQTR